MKAFRTTLVDGRIFYIAHYTKGEALTALEYETGISRTEVASIARTARTHGENKPGVQHESEDTITV